MDRFRVEDIGSVLNDNGTFLFTSESVGEGHPDKICDQVSDAILDAHLEQDPQAIVGCETCTKTGMIFVCGEITSTAVINYEKVVRDTIQKIGYDDSCKGFDYKTCSVLLSISRQYDIAGVNLDKADDEVGASDQGIMFGYATDETKEFMPLTVVLAHNLSKKLAEYRRNGTFWWACPDTKTQVTAEYILQNGAAIPQRIHTVVMSTQHFENASLEEVRHDVQMVIKEVIPTKYLDKETKYYINPCGPFVIGGPKSDAGLTGRKIIVDTYGGWGAHGGGSFSGKDCTKVNRSAAYAARWVAKSLVTEGLCKRCLIQLSYAIGIAEPISISVFHYGTSKYSTKELLKIVKANFDLRPGAIVRDLDLKKPIYKATSIYGHFSDDKFPWEQSKHLIIPDFN